MLKEITNSIKFIVLNIMLWVAAPAIVWEATAQVNLASSTIPTSGYEGRVFALFSPRGWGTGWVTNIPGFKKLYVVTAAHVCEDNAYLQSKEWGMLRTLVIDFTHDTCILEFPFSDFFKLKGLHPLEFSVGYPDYLEEIHAISRTKPDQEQTISGVLIRFTQVRIEQYGFNYNAIRHTAPTVPGSSGGPILNSRGKVVCMTTMVWMTPLKHTPIVGDCVVTGDIQFSAMKFLRE